MDKYKHITEMENIKNETMDKLEELDRILDYFNDNAERYSSLIEYYYSDLRNQDLKDDENGLIPKNLRRGVLSEDEIYNLSIDYNQKGLKMMEIALKMFKA